MPGDTIVMNLLPALECECGNERHLSALSDNWNLDIEGWQHFNMIECSNLESRNPEFKNSEFRNKITVLLNKQFTAIFGIVYNMFCLQIYTYSIYLQHLYIIHMVPRYFSYFLLIVILISEGAGPPLPEPILKTCSSSSGWRSKCMLDLKIQIYLVQCWYSHGAHLAFFLFGSNASIKLWKASISICDTPLRACIW